MSGSAVDDDNDPPAVAAQKAVDAEKRAADSTLPDPERITEYLQWGLLALFVIFALVAAVGLYGSAGRIIEVWVAREYQPIFGAAFNLFVLLVAVAGITAVLRRLR